MPQKNQIDIEKELAATRRELLQSGIQIALVSASLGAIGLAAANAATFEWEKYRSPKHAVSITIVDNGIISTESSAPNYVVGHNEYMATVSNNGNFIEYDLEIRTSVDVRTPFDDSGGVYMAGAASNSFITDHESGKWEEYESTSLRYLHTLPTLQPGEIIYSYIAINQPVNIRVECRNKEISSVAEIIQWKGLPISPVTSPQSSTPQPV